MFIFFLSDLFMQIKNNRFWRPLLVKAREIIEDDVFLPLDITCTPTFADQSGESWRKKKVFFLFCFFFLSQKTQGSRITLSQSQAGGNVIELQGGWGRPNYYFLTWKNKSLVLYILRVFLFKSEHKDLNVFCFYYLFLILLFWILKRGWQVLPLSHPWHHAPKSLVQMLEVKDAVVCAAEPKTICLLQKWPKTELPARI